MNKYCNSFLFVQKKYIYFLFLAVIFFISYKLLPLYSANQNTYFVHGLAKAGFGFLNEDWFANTVDSVPLFSFVVGLTYQYLNKYLFYFYYLLIFSVYIYSILGIVSTVFDIKSSKLKYLTFFVLYMMVHSVLFSYLSLKLFGRDLAWYLHVGVAGQYILGPVFQPTTFGVFLILSIYLFLKNKVLWAIIVNSVAATMHPTYLMSTVILDIAFVLMFIVIEKNLKKSLWIGLFGFILILPILFYVYHSFSHISPCYLTKSQEILVNVRIPHHAIPGQWLDTSVYCQLFLMVFSFYLIRKTNLFPIMIIAFSAGMILTIFQAVSGSNQLALLFPWRISTVLMPISTSMIIAYLVLHIFKLFYLQIHKYRRLLSYCLGLLIIACMVFGVRQKLYAYKSFHNDDSVFMMDFIKETKQSGYIYLIPINMESFRLYSAAPVFVDFKNHPYAVEEVIEWYKRILLADSIYVEPNNINCDKLIDLAKGYGVTHIVLENNHFKVIPDCLQIVYHDKRFAVYLIIYQ